MSAGLKVIIPAAGGGTRLAPHTHTTPKVLLHVAGKPILGHIIDLVSTVNPEEVIVVVGAQGERIEQYLRATYRLNLSFVTQSEPLGLGHAIAQAKDLAAGHPTLILLGDTILDLDLQQLKPNENAIVLCAVENPRRFGVAELRGGFVSHVVEKPVRPKGNLAIVGVYYFADSTPLFAALDDLIRQDKKTRGEYQLTDALLIMLKKGTRLRPITMNAEHWLDCGTADALLDTNAYLLARRHHVRERAGVVVIPPVNIDDSAVIEHSIVGPNVSIGARAVIRNSVVRDSIINQEVLVENAVLEHSILGEAAVFQGRALHLNLGSSSELKGG
jgi:glucose-1-phosphate thymidylyltransferase